MTITACDTEISINKEHIVFFNDNVIVETTENSATVKTIKPYIVSGSTKENVVIYLEYWAANDTTKQKAELYTENNGYVIFTIEGLTPETTYNGQVVMGCEEHDDTEYGEVFTFTTLEHVPVANYTCTCNVDAKGVLADVTLSNVAFTLDGVESPLAKVEFKYAQKLSGGQWATVEVSAEELANGFRIPREGDAYLTEESNYNYTVTLHPEDNSFESYTLKGEFTTVKAELSSNIETPTITATDDTLHLSSKVPVLYVDGEVIPDYAELAYKFYYSNKVDYFDYIDAECADGIITATVKLNIFEEGVTYNFRSCLDINDAFVMTSDDVPYTMPVTTTPPPPAPPVSGDADTTAIAGEWHLTSWRGAVPSFDVYLSISEDGVVTLWQRMESRLWETFYSIVSIDGSIIAGEYTDGTAWAASYYVTIAGDTMTWTNTADSAEVSVYTRCTLPDFTNPEIRTTSAVGKRFL